MAAERHHILLLAGTQEARLLAKALADAFPERRLTVSFAGAVRDLPELDVPVRVGGFGGVAGLIDYAGRDKVSLIIDATHPFAARMSGNAVEAARALDLPLIRLERPQWTSEPGDRWHPVASTTEAAARLPAGARAFLAIGRKDIQLFCRRTDIFGLVRMIEPPSAPLPEHWKLILKRPPLSAEEEIALFQTHRISHVVTKNSGGMSSYAKIDAARRLGLDVIMVERPVLAETETVPDIRAVIRALGSAP
ncbi:cobalt-precorrin-6A reductase [Roseibium salinum]|uniref:Cobalt-precorrin-6A reductase n=1 Tax=Roseibium salinum TaxID=1604349 RepID=A0ABT3R4V0_9HYPH|nr:cobalt-precorrin-6A reductase [Roseibium sp. DSM 29163]MCX2724230.1 cobalt-precorrin-6A reductase [Roseibium sp. DSM 29163]MDN3721719.1 cobalt-precorrin-6A reductase [Roseibium salinum]